MRFDELGYRNRLYLLLGQEHYSPLIVDEWSDPERYLNSFERDPNPARVTYKVWPALEHQVETVGTPEGATLDYAFDGAYWVDGLTVRSGDPAAPGTTGTFDATTHGRGVPTYLTVPGGERRRGRSHGAVRDGRALVARHGNTPRRRTRSKRR